MDQKPPRLPLMREVDSPQAKTEGERTRRMFLAINPMATRPAINRCYKNLGLSLPQSKPQVLTAPSSEGAKDYARLIHDELP